MSVPCKHLIDASVIYVIFWLLWVFVAAHGLSLVAVSGGHSLPVVL